MRREFAAPLRRRFSAAPSPRIQRSHQLQRRQLLTTAEGEEATAVEEEEGYQEEVSIANRSYWTKKIHRLCSAQDGSGGGGVDEALRLLDHLRLRGYRPDSLNLNSVVHGLCTSGRSGEAHRRLLLSAASGWVPDDRTSNVLVARLLDARTPHLTLRVLNRLVAAKPGFIPSRTNYNRLIDLFCSDSQPADALKLFLDMKSRGHHPNAVSYTALINGFARIGDLSSARMLFDEMVESGVSPNALTHSVLIKAVLRNRKIEEGKEMIRELWVRMEDEEDPSVNNAAFANLIGALCREGYFHEVFRIAEEMPQGKCIGEEFVYVQMMDSLCRFGRHHGASRIVYIMRKRGFIPSLVSYNCIVLGLSKEGEGGCMRAYQLFKEGIEFGYSLPELTYKALIEGLCRERDLYKAKDVTEFMLGKEGINKTRIYNIFLSALRLVDNPSEQLNVLVSMIQNQCRPDVVTLNTVIHGFCKIGKVNEGMKILNDMLNGKFCTPDVVTFTTILHGLLDVGRMEVALDVLHVKMPECRCSPSIVTYNGVLHGLCKLQKVDEAMEVFHEMMHKGVSVDSTTHTIIIEGLWDMGRIKEAKTFWEDVIWPSKIHDDFVYAAILRGLCNLGKLNEACDFLYELVDCRVAPGIVNYNILIDNACKLGLKGEAYQIVGEMKKNGLTPDAVTWRILDKFHENERKACAPCLQILESKATLEDIKIPTTHLIAKIAGSPYREKECNVKVEVDEVPLEGIVDLDFSTGIEVDSIDNKCNDISESNLCRDMNKARSAQSESREPLSRMALRVFGLL